MNVKLKAIFIAVGIFIILFILMQFFAPDKFLTRLWSKSGTLKVESVPSTNVFVDSNLVGQTPLQITLKEGVHTVKLVPESSGKNHTTWTSRVRLFHNTTTYINRELGLSDLLSSGEVLTLEKSGSNKGQILVNTAPSGMFVALDGEDRGIAPLFMDNVNPGEHELGVRGEGLVPRSMKVNVVTGYKLLADFQLAIDEEYKKKKEEEKKKTEKKKTTVASVSNTVQILDTPTGWLRVRAEPSLGASESAKVDSGRIFTFTEKEGPWYNIEYEPDKTGWVYGDYVKEVQSVTPTPTR